MNRRPLNRRSLAGLVVLVAGALALSGCASGDGAASGPSGSGGKTTLKLATIGIMSDGGLALGEKQGFFADEGLTLQTTVVANPAAGLAAAQSGQVDLAYSPSIPVLNALSQSVPLQIVQAADGYPDETPAGEKPADLDDTGLYTSPSSGIKDIAGLAGKTIAVPARKAQLEVTISAALAKAGVDPKSINWVVLDFASAVSALKSGSVAAAGLVSPFTTQAKSAGATLVSSPGISFFEKGAVGLWVAGKSTISAKADAIAAFERAVAKTNAYANAHPKEAIAEGIKLTKSTLTVDQVTEPYWPTEVREADIQRANEQLAKLGFLPKPVSLSGVIYQGKS